MDAFKAIKTRRSVRQFEKKKVSQDKIEKILDAGLRAPSSKNCQPWHFIVLKGKKKDKIVEITENNFYEPAWIKTKTTLLSCNIIKQAPVLILVFNKGPISGGEKHAARNTKLSSAIIAESLSIGASIENMLITATSLGLSSLWIGDLRNAKQRIEKYFKTKYDLIAGVAIGYGNVRSFKMT